MKPPLVGSGVLGEGKTKVDEESPQTRGVRPNLVRTPRPSRNPPPRRRLQRRHFNTTLHPPRRPQRGVPHLSVTGDLGPKNRHVGGSTYRYRKSRPVGEAPRNYEFRLVYTRPADRCRRRVIPDEGGRVLFHPGAPFAPVCGIHSGVDRRFGTRTEERGFRRRLRGWVVGGPRSPVLDFRLVQKGGVVVMKGCNLGSRLG